MIERSALLDEFRTLQTLAISLENLQRSIVESLARSFAHFNWVGFYMLDPADDQMLVVGPFVGDPTPHVRIPVNEGICGAAVERGETVVVDDVNSDPRYLSCSIETRSEIVVPIYAGGKIVGEIDIDSHAPAAFNGDDRAFLEEVAKIVGRFIEEHPVE
ncbi:MAG TPA: GAF domain-containing protein [Terracidiphilus sp.]|nr:GAF domain-containing protein [Terracidiphilus sp.]